MTLYSNGPSFCLPGFVWFISFFHLTNLRIKLLFAECGNYHSLKWYRDSTRVFVYSPIAGFKNAEDILMDRWSLINEWWRGWRQPTSVEDEILASYTWLEIECYQLVFRMIEFRMLTQGKKWEGKFGCCRCLDMSQASLGSDCPRWVKLALFFFFFTFFDLKHFFCQGGLSYKFLSPCGSFPPAAKTCVSRFTNRWRHCAPA